MFRLRTNPPAPPDGFGHPVVLPRLSPAARSKRWSPLPSAPSSSSSSAFSSSKQLYSLPRATPQQLRRAHQPQKLNSLAPTPSWTSTSRKRRCTSARSRQRESSSNCSSTLRGGRRSGTQRRRGVSTPTTWITFAFSPRAIWRSVRVWRVKSPCCIRQWADSRLSCCTPAPVRCSSREEREVLASRCNFRPHQRPSRRRGLLQMNPPSNNHPAPSSYTSDPVIDSAVVCPNRDSSRSFLTRSHSRPNSRRLRHQSRCVSRIVRGAWLLSAVAPSIANASGGDRILTQTRSSWGLCFAPFFKGCTRGVE
ncbi:hypothetical protein VC83_05981 [Pseudogymnoascus destructans]|uniref:Uncharacterized protein n=1 Tax=Pseudogymnoascus destructans TaxID=655981 RepID=A0A177A4E2_9PEZI|nr:uncharacterized protein VC83_05981 [Pseudogymnoascus destructans]OAF56997.1 hypothetical protein VC83_05981 [Pseudogymnoascus destructans]